MRALALAIALAATGCSNLLGLDDPQLTDAGTGDPDGPIDGPDLDAPANTVTGRSYYRKTDVFGTTTETPIDNTASLIQALIPDGNQPTGFRSAVGTGMADGTFVVNDVPDGVTYTLKIGRNYYVTDDHTIDQHFDLPVRDAVATATGTTTVDMTVDSMSPFVFGPEGVDDLMDVFSFGVAYQGSFSLDHGSTSLTRSYDWSEGFGFVFGDLPLPDAAFGDSLLITHSRNELVTVGSGRKVRTTRVIDWFDAGNVTVTDGATIPLAGVFMPATNNRTLMVNYTRGAFDSAYPPTGSVSASVMVLAHPTGNDFGWGVNLGMVAMDDWSRSPTPSIFHTLAYADPLPATWSRHLYESYNLTRWVKIPGALTPRPVIFSGYSRDRVLPAGLPSLAPALQPPGMIRIEGQDINVGGKVDFDGSSPVTLTWSPVAGAKAYAVTVQRVFLNGTQTRSAIAAQLFTEATTLDIPAEVFAGGEFFAFSVGSTTAPADYASGEVVLNGTPNASARVPSGLFRLSSSCGNGGLDTGENCDTSGESATCDVDCSTVACGDGLRNAAAGEQCDHVQDSLGCDGDCTLPVCGDGYTNGQTEDCDDGNTLDEGNGCSTACRFDNQCGDAMLQLYGEQCDEGGDTVNCDSDCTPAECGDGHLNPQANEQCDNGFGNGVGGCDGACQLMP